MRLDSPWLYIYKIPNFFMMFFISILCISSGLGVIYAKHKARTLHIKLQNIYAECSELNTEWSKLLLERSTLLADFRVEKLARDNLNMINPEQIHIIRQ